MIHCFTSQVLTRLEGKCKCRTKNILTHLTPAVQGRVDLPAHSTKRGAAGFLSSHLLSSVGDKGNQVLIFINISRVFHVFCETVVKHQARRGTEPHALIRFLKITLTFPPNTNYYYASLPASLSPRTPILTSGEPCGHWAGQGTAARGSSCASGGR